MNPLVRLFCITALVALVGCTGNDSEPQPDAGPTLGQDAGADAGTTTTDGGADGGRPDGGGTDGGVDASREYCQALCTHETTCNPLDTSDFCNTATCTAQAAVYLDAARASLRTCLSASCSVNEDECFIQAGDAMPPRAIDETFRTHCTSRQTACGGDIPTWMCDFTNNTEILLESAVQAGDTCLAKPCAEVVDCVIEAWGGPK
jgi:hypothetical protein